MILILCFILLFAKYKIKDQYFEAVLWSLGLFSYLIVSSFVSLCGGACQIVAAISSKCMYFIDTGRHIIFNGAYLLTLLSIWQYIRCYNGTLSIMMYIFCDTLLLSCMFAVVFKKSKICLIRQ